MTAARDEAAPGVALACAVLMPAAMQSQHYLTSLLLLVACSASAHDAANATDAGANADSAGSAVTVASITPEDGARHAGVFSVVVVQLTGSADASSVDTTSVALFVGETGQAVVANVAYNDGAHTITITPAYPLVRATSYRVEVSGLQAQGVAIAPAVARFRTVENPIIDSTSLDVNGAVTAERNITYDELDRPMAEIDDAAGPDGVVGTPDDSVTWIAHTFPGGRIDRQLTYAPGPDGKVQTTDDVPIAAYVARSSTYGQTNGDWYSGAGSDGQWFTADDVATRGIRQEYDGLGRLQKSESFGAGADGIDGTPDDVVDDWRDWTYSAHDVSTIDRVSPGGDGTWFTTDDEQWERDVTSLDDRDGVIDVAYLDCSATGNCNTSHTEYSDQWFIRNGGYVLQLWSAAAGDDNTWGTADDAFRTWILYTIDPKGNIETAEYVFAGLDGVLGTDDDYEYMREQYDTTR